MWKPPPSTSDVSSERGRLACGRAGSVGRRVAVIMIVAALVVALAATAWGAAASFGSCPVTGGEAPVFGGAEAELLRW
jgi:hypothetical protein